MDPRNLSFEQREGLAPLPSQLQRDQMSNELRSQLWAYVNDLMSTDSFGIYHGSGRWADILRDAHLYRYHMRKDQFSSHKAYLALGELFEKGEYHEIYGWLDYVMRHDKSLPHFGGEVGVILTNCRSAYRVVDDMIIPIASEEEQAAYEGALADTSAGQFSGARSHLKQAGMHLTNGSFANSVRESISAVESVARVLEPSGDFSKALAKLEIKLALHPALKRGFTAIYGYTSDEGGIRHALLESGQAAVDETDAVFFLGACSAFVSYLIGKSQNAGSA